MVTKLIRIARHNWSSFVYPGILTVLGLGFALVPLAKGELFFYWDNAQIFYPQTDFLHQALRSGHISQWWFQVGSGLPIVGEGQAAHYHPIRLLLAYLFTPPVAFMTELGVYLAVAGLSTYFFLREFRVRRPACLLGGICQVFGSFSVVFVKNIALHRSFWVFPLAMLLAERFVTRQRFSYAFAMSLVIGLQLLSGHPTFAMITVVATSVYILSRALQRSWHRNESLQLLVRQLCGAMLQWGLATTLGFAIAGIQVLPQLLHVEHSIRQGGLSFEYAMSSSPTKMRYLPQLLFPYVYEQGDLLERPNWWGTYFNEVPYGGIYIGALPVLLALLSLWWQRHWPDPAWPLAVCFLFAIGLALGAKTPLFPILWALPGMNGIRYPSRFLMWASFCLACLAALGLHRLLARSRLAHLQKQDLIPFFLLAGCVLLLASFLWSQREMLAGVVNIAPDVRSGIVISLVLFAIAFGLAWSLLTLRHRYQSYLLLLVVLFVFADLWIFRIRSGYAPAVPIREALAPPNVVKFLRTDHDLFRVMSLATHEEKLFNRKEDLREFLQADTSAIWGIESADVWSSLKLKRYYAIREAIVWELTNSPQAAEKLAGFLGALNVKYVVAPESATLRGWEKVHRTLRAVTWKNPAFLPRAFLVGRIIPEQIEVRDEWIGRSITRLEDYHQSVSNWYTRVEEAQIVDNIVLKSIDYRTTAVVAGKDLPTLSGMDVGSEVHARPPQTDAMSFDVNSRKPALLVISNNYYPGWSATVNAQPTKIFRTNYISMGIPVPTGRSEIVLRFVTPGFRLGAIISSISLCLCLTGLLAPRIRKISWALTAKTSVHALPSRNV